MKIVNFERSGKPEKLELTADPLVIWLDRRTQLRIERGDALAKVSSAVQKVWGLHRDEAHQLVAFWFALGERALSQQLDDPWRKAELSTKVERTYASGVRPTPPVRHPPPRAKRKRR